MRFGVCMGSKGPEYIEIIKKKGFDYVEVPFNSLQRMDDETFETVKKELKKWELKYETYNSFFHKTMDVSLVGEAVDLNVVKDYARPLFERAEQIGGRVAVIGSGNSRKIPEGFSRGTAVEQYAEFLYTCGEMAKEHGMDIAIEHLNYEETNFINTFEEAVEMCKITGHKNVFALADFFHMYSVGEDFSVIEKHGKYLKHVHLAKPDPTRTQLTMADKDICIKWGKILKNAGYDLRASLESKHSEEFERSIEQTREVVEFMK